MNSCKNLFLFLLSFAFVFTLVNADDLYFRNVSGNFSVPANWSLSSGGPSNGHVPTIDDRVFLDVNSGDLTIDNDYSILSLDCTGYIGQLTHKANKVLVLGTNALSSGVVAKFSESMTYIAEDSTASVTFDAESDVVLDVDFGGQKFGTVVVKGYCTIRFLSDLTTVENSKIRFESGTLNTNSKNITCGMFESPAPKQRELILGKTTLNIKGKEGETSSFYVSSGSFSVSSDAAAVVNIYRGKTSHITYFIRGGVDAINWGFTLNFINGGTANIEAPNDTFRNVTVAGGPNRDDIEDVIQIRSNITIEKYFSIVGNSPYRRLRVIGSNPNVITISSSKAVLGRYADFYDVKLSQQVDLSNMLGGSGDANGNENIIFTPSMTCYWKSGVAGTYQWHDDSHWFKATDGAGGKARRPLPQDDVVFDSNSIGATGTTINISRDVLRLGRNISWAAVVNNPTWNFEPEYKDLNDSNTLGTSVCIFGDLELSSSMTLTAPKKSCLVMLGNGQNKTIIIKGMGKMIPQKYVSIAVNSTNTFEAVTSFILSSASTLSTDTDLGISSSGYNSGSVGKVDFGYVAVSAGAFSKNASGDFKAHGSITLYGTGTVWNIESGLSGNFDVTSSVISLTAQSVEEQVFKGGGKTYHRLEFFSIASYSDYYEADVRIEGSNTFTEIKDERSAGREVSHSVIFEAGSTNTIISKVKITSVADKYVFLRSSNANQSFTLSSSGSATLTGNYLIVSDCALAGTWASITPGANSVDAGGNVNWSAFTTQPFVWTGLFDNWSNATKWTGGVVPGANDIAIFTGSSVSCDINVPTSCKGIILTPKYTGNLLVFTTLAIGNVGIVQHGGTFISYHDFSNAGGFNQSAGDFQAGGYIFEVAAQKKVRYTWRTKGSATFPYVVVKIIGVSTPAIVSNDSNSPIGNLIWNTSGELYGSFFVNGNISFGSVVNFADVTLRGNLLGGYQGGSGIYRFVGSNTQAINSSNLPNVEVNKSGGSLNITQNLSVKGSWVHVAGNINWDGHLLSFDGVNGGDIKGRFNQMTINNSYKFVDDVTLSSSLIVNGSLDLAGHNVTVTGNMIFSGGATLKLKGAEEITTGGTLNLSQFSTTVFYDAGYTVNVSGIATYFGNVVLGAGKAHEFEVGSTVIIRGNLTTDSDVYNRAILRPEGNIAGQWEISVQGSVNLGAAVSVKGSKNIGASSITAKNSIDEGRNLGWLGLKVVGAVPEEIPDYILEEEANKKFVSGGGCQYNPSADLTLNSEWLLVGAFALFVTIARRRKSA